MTSSFYKEDSNTYLFNMISISMTTLAKNGLQFCRSMVSIIWITWMCKCNSPTLVIVFLPIVLNESILIISQGRFGEPSGRNEEKMNGMRQSNWRGLMRKRMY